VRDEVEVLCDVEKEVDQQLPGMVGFFPLRPLKTGGGHFQSPRMDAFDIIWGIGIWAYGNAPQKYWQYNLY